MEERAAKMAEYYVKNISPDWPKLVASTKALLQEEADLNEIVQLVGIDALSPKDRLTLSAAQMIREDYLQQDAMDQTDSYTSPRKQYLMLSLIHAWHEMGKNALEVGVPFQKIESMKVCERIARMKYIEESEKEEDTAESDNEEEKESDKKEDESGEEKENPEEESGDKKENNAGAFAGL